MDKDSRITCSCGAPATDRSGDMAGAPICDKYPHCIPSSRGTAPNSHPQDGGPREIVWDGSPSPQPPKPSELAKKIDAHYRKHFLGIAPEDERVENLHAECIDEMLRERVGELEAQLATMKTQRDEFIETAQGETRSKQNAIAALEKVEREREELRNALTNLLKALRPELTGPPKNVPKSSYAAQWDEAERLVR